MLTQETKRKIDSARDILVGKVPDPKAQVEQITTAMIYKFMDDMDKDAVELGGKARFFTNGFEKYAWSKLLDPKLGGHERLDLYAEAIVQMSSNPHIPQLFRDIFKDAFLPYRNPETLSLFLKEINSFTYDHSEDLGDAFEYLLSIMGSQGDAGQFRTPRHIIDFIVAVVDPKKDDSILDPACGTAGFLISAYKHILKQHDGKDDPKHKEKPLTPDDKKRLMNNLFGYDISPDMVKLSKVNMYLHGFAEPKIFEYDTLSSDEKWDEMYDVIMANPPFMTPKGGIRPHKRFSVQANRAEVLFVDYIKEHLRPNGRAGIIVPEGIIFKNDSAYKHLRKLLVEDGLFAVVSLPAGVFNPYSGVKTSILFLDNSLAKKTNHILFIKTHNDGFDLGAQRRSVIGSDLPLALDVLLRYKKHADSNGSYSIGGWPEGKYHIDTHPNCQFFLKEEIAKDDDYNLSGDRYKQVDTKNNQKWPMVELQEVCSIARGGSPRPINEYLTDSPKGINWIKIGDVAKGEKYIRSTKEKIKPEGISKTRLVKEGDFILSNSMSFGRPYILKISGAIHDGWLLLRLKNDKLLPDFLYYVLGNPQTKAQFEKLATGGVVRNLNSNLVRKVKIPLPPINVQKEIVDQIEKKQQEIECAKILIENLEREQDEILDSRLS